ncbi:S41 family peptidase [Reichenbachiella sp. MALMAid0571]|uniref:S41 family peptidase n=1 Tax=Reichenbachiella sp. MALMAid0571 TaxID=3143939 RepID=UPI0032DE3729
MSMEKNGPKIFTITLILFLVLLLDSCQPHIATGIWKQRGYGRILKVDGSEFSIYTSTDGYCNELSSKGKFDKHFKIVSIDENELIIDHGSTRNYHFTRINELPSVCGSGNENFDTNPIKNFSVFWQLFEENYAFFEQRGIDWNEVNQYYTPKVEQIKSESEFYQLIKSILDSLHDGHVKIRVPESTSTEANKNDFNFEQVKVEIPDAILNKYVASPKSYNVKTISWGKLKGTNVGYIVVPKMFGFPNYGLSEDDFNKKLNEVFDADPGPGYDYFQEERRGVDFVMEKIHADLGDTDSIVFDLRFNEGGFSSVSLKLLSHFIHKPYKAYTRTIEKNTEEPLVQDYIIKPAMKNIFNQKICLLTSYWSASASEIFALSSMPSDNFTRYGSKTNGVLSEVAWCVLPNGWEISMSVEVVSDPIGKEYEVVGVPVDFDMNYPENGMDFYQSFYQHGEFADPLLEKFLK